jgi:hypothetical protein
MPALPSSILEALWVQVAGRSPVDRGKQGLKRSILTEAGGTPVGVVPGSPRRPTAATTGCWQRPWTRSRWSGCRPPSRWCTWSRL